MVSYRLAPSNPFPCALHDVFAWYMHLIQPQHSLFTTKTMNREAISAKDIIIAGDSAGGGLCLCLLEYMRNYLMLGSDALPLGTNLFNSLAIRFRI